MSADFTDWRRLIQNLNSSKSRSRRSMRAVTAAKQRPGFQTKRSLIEIALDVGYTSPSAFAQVFRRVVGVTPTEFRSAL
ncbi:MAG: helix-turn-helix domain-containing protein [Chthoniobacterales bacterium]